MYYDLVNCIHACRREPSHSMDIMYDDKNNTTITGIYTEEGQGLQHGALIFSSEVVAFYNLGREPHKVCAALYVYTN